MEQKNLFGGMSNYPISKETQDLVEDVLKGYPASRDSDMVLLAHVWRKQGAIKDAAKLVEFGARAETITRHRRKLQELGKYVGTRQAQRKGAQRAFSEGVARTVLHPQGIPKTNA